MDLTQETILQHGRHSPYQGELENPTIRVEMNNPLCGDSLKMDFKIDQGQLTDICFTGEGCLISQAAASLLIQEMKKTKDLKVIKTFNKDTIFGLLGIQLTPARIQCAMLSLETLRKALTKI